MTAARPVQPKSREPTGLPHFPLLGAMEAVVMSEWGNPLWVAIENCINCLLENPRVLIDYEPNFDGGLNAAIINALAGATVILPETGDGRSRTIAITHPTNPDVVKWTVRDSEGFCPDLRNLAWESPKMKRTVAALRAWQANRLPIPNNPKPPKATKPKKGDKIKEALRLLELHPEWEDKKIAAKAGCSSSNLSQHPVYRKARQTIRRGGKGTHKSAYNARTGETEVFDAN